MLTVENAARLVVAEADVDKKYKFDISFLFVIIELLQAIIPILQNCDLDPEKVLSKAKKPRRIDTLLLKLRSRRILGSRAYRKYGGKAIVGAMVKVGAKSTAQDIQDLYDEI